MSITSATPHRPNCTPPLVNAAMNNIPAPSAVLAAKPSTEWRNAGSSRLASRNSTM